MGPSADDLALTPDADADTGADWHRRVVGRSLRTATERSVDRGLSLIRAAVTVLNRSNGEDITVQDIADEAGQSLRTLYQYFESKDDLLLAVFEEAMRTYASMIGARHRAARRPARAPRRSDGRRRAAGRGARDRRRSRPGPPAPEALGGPARDGGPGAGIGERAVRGLVEDAAAAGRIVTTDAEGATFALLSLNSAYITTGHAGERRGRPAPGRGGAGHVLPPGPRCRARARVVRVDLVPAAARVAPVGPQEGRGGEVRLAASRMPEAGTAVTGTFE